VGSISFREYLKFKDIASFEPCSVEDLFSDHQRIAANVMGQIKPLMHFKEYLTKGCYPFVLQSDQSYNHRLIGVINQILEVDMPYVTNIKYAQIDKIKKLIYLLSTSVPLKPKGIF